MLKRLGGAALLGALAYTTADAAADSALYWRARGLVMEQAVAHERLCRELGGPPLQAGPWYNSSVAISHDGHIATVTMPLRGNRRSSDVTVRVSAMLVLLLLLLPPADDLTACCWQDPSCSFLDTPGLGQLRALPACC